MRLVVSLSALVPLLALRLAGAFVLRPTTSHVHLQRSYSQPNFARQTVSVRFYNEAQDPDFLPLESMRVREIQEELRERRVSYTDCFDKESLVRRLKEARETTALAAIDDDEEEEEDFIIPEVLEKGDYTGFGKHTGVEESFDYENQLSELRAKSVRSLREECAKRQIQWAHFVEKEELVQALMNVMERTVQYSVSGFIHAGLVADLTADQLELEFSEQSEAPLLLVIYATWAGPCQTMDPELSEAAFRLGTRMRVAKLDSDKYPAMAQRLRAGGLPTVIIMNGDRELQRIEGAMKKEQVLQFVDPFISGRS